MIPHMRATLASNANKNFKQYSENQAASDSDLSTLKDQNKSLQSQVEELQSKIKDLQGGDPTQVSGVQEVYDALIGAYDDYQKNKKADAADKLVKINADRLTSDVAKSCYDKIKRQPMRLRQRSILKRDVMPIMAPVRIRREIMTSPLSC